MTALEITLQIFVILILVAITLRFRWRFQVRSGTPEGNMAQCFGVSIFRHWRLGTILVRVMAGFAGLYLLVNLIMNLIP